MPAMRSRTRSSKAEYRAASSRCSRARSSFRHSSTACWITAGETEAVAGPRPAGPAAVVAAVKAFRTPYNDDKKAISTHTFVTTDQQRQTRDTEIRRNGERDGVEERREVRTFSRSSERASSLRTASATCDARNDSAISRLSTSSVTRAAASRRSCSRSCSLSAPPRRCGEATSLQKDN